MRLWDNSASSSAERKYLEQARVGGVYGLDISVSPWKHWGLGLLHTQFFASASDSNVTFVDKSQGSARDKYRIFYTAPGIYVMQPVGEKLRLVGNAGAGIFFYRNEAEKGAFPGVLEGSALGFHAAGSADVLVVPRFAIGFGARAFYGELDDFRYNAIKTHTRPLSLSRVDFGVGVRFYP
ncbi:MAG TPA: hypothetical protein VHO02_06390 [Fibrobacteria bacterium]|nr:hypothetical protein [Fibrobacteria bacterium]